MRDPKRLEVLVRWRERGEDAARRALAEEQARELRAQEKLQAERERLQQAKPFSSSVDHWVMAEFAQTSQRQRVAQAERALSDQKQVVQTQVVELRSAREKAEVMRRLTERAREEVTLDLRRKEIRESDEQGRIGMILKQRAV